MTFQATPATLGVVAAAAAAAAGWLIREEWRRPDRRRLPWRIAATLLAVLALVLLGLRPAWRAGRPSGQGRGLKASLDTPGGRPIPTAAALRFALPLPGTAVPPGAVILPDVAALRRNYPQVDTLHIYGDGLEPFDLDALRGLRVLFHPPDALRGSPPAITFLRCPRVLPLGTPLTLQGRVDGLPPGATAALTLVAPDGSTTETATPPAARDGSAVFTLHGPAPPAVGRFDWRLRLARGGTLSDDPLGIAVVRPALPRVLVLETTPRFDTAALRRWFERAGGTVAARTQVGKDLYRFFGPASSGGAPGEFRRVDGPLLAGFDLVLADGRSLLALTDPERAAVRSAVADTGLGVLTLADDAVLPAAGNPVTEAAKSPATFLLPWALQLIGGGTGGEEPAAENADRSVRLRWPGMPPSMDAPASAAPWEIGMQPAQAPLIRDDQGRAVAAEVPLGRGWLALTLVRNTDRWNRADGPAAFAAYWSHLFSRIARRDEADGCWSLADGEAGPVRAGEPLELVWQGASAAPLTPAVVTDETGTRATLPFIQDAAEPTRWRTVFWPRRPGWHRATRQDAAPRRAGEPFDFFAAAPDDWPALSAARRRLVTARFAAASRDPAETRAATVAAAEAAPAAGWWFGLFLVGAGSLWVERRFSAGRSAAAAAAPVG